MKSVKFCASLLWVEIRQPRACKKSNITQDFHSLQTWDSQKWMIGCLMMSQVAMKKLTKRNGKCKRRRKRRFSRKGDTNMVSVNQPVIFSQKSTFSQVYCKKKKIHNPQFISWLVILLFLTKYMHILLSPRGKEEKESRWRQWRRLPGGEWWIQWRCWARLYLKWFFRVSGIPNLFFFLLISLIKKSTWFLQYLFAKLFCVWYTAKARRASI